MQRWSLTVYAPNQAPRTHEYAENTLVVGSQDAQGVLALAVPGVAARHALLHMQGGLLRVEALDPSAAVFVQGTAISAPVEIGCPASIRIGEAELKITVCAEMAEAARASDSTLRVVHPAHFLRAISRFIVLVEPDADIFRRQRRRIQRLDHDLNHRFGTRVVRMTHVHVRRPPCDPAHGGCLPLGGNAPPQ